MFGFAMLVVGALVTVVLPQITELLESLNQPLPFYTRWIIAISHFARAWWWALGLGAAVDRASGCAPRSAPRAAATAGTASRCACPWSAARSA